MFLSLSTKRPELKHNHMMLVTATIIRLVLYWCSSGQQVVLVILLSLSKMSPGQVLRNVQSFAENKFLAFERPARPRK